MTSYLLDTHAIYWMESRDPRLSPAAADVFAAASAGKVKLIAHAIVLAELCFLYRKVGYAEKFPPLLDYMRFSPLYRFDPIEIGDVRRLADFTEIPEMHDRLIAVAAERLGVTILTCDPMIRRSSRVSCLW